ncbi:MAG: prkC 29 [Gemmataceae bacterium]|nr:prkC 29 [Gemmataceae bacterium]
MPDSGPLSTPEDGPGTFAGPSSRPEAVIALPASRSRGVDKIPRAFGRYRIQDCLGKGGMGAVFRAHDTQLDRLVALKIPFLDGDDTDMRQRFYREARAAATLQHANICPVFDVGEQDGVPYLTMAFIQGRSLAQLLESGRPFTPQQIAILVRKLAVAMQEAHSHGVIHRDLKPSNVLLRSNGEPVVMDFGLARRADDRATEGLTRQGDVIGTLEYMSPEQVDGDNLAVGPAADVYALGVLLYEMLTGRRPFTGTTASILASILLKPPARPSELRPGVPPRLEEICLKAMARQPADRFATMAKFAAALTEYLRSPDQETGPAAARSAEAAPTPSSGGPTPPIRTSAVARPPARVEDEGRPPPPAPKATPVQETAPAPRVKASSGTRRPRSSARRKAAKKKSNRPLVIGGIAAAVCLSAVVVAILAWPRGKSNLTSAPGQTALVSPPSNPAPPPAGSAPTQQTSPTLASANPTAQTAPPGTSTPPAKTTPPSSAPRTPPALRLRPDGVTLAVGEQREVTVEVDHRGNKEPINLRWSGPKEVRVSPPGPLTVRPGEPNPVFTLRLMAEPAAGNPQIDVTAAPGQDARSDAVTARLPVQLAPGPCARVIEVAEKPDAEIGAMAFAPDASLALVSDGSTRPDAGKAPAKQAEDGNAVRVWNLSRGELLSPLSGHTGRVTGLAVSADGKTALSVSADDTVALWDLARGRRSSQSPRQALHVLGAAVAPDAKLGLAVYPRVIVKVNLEQFQAIGQPIKTTHLLGSDLEDAVRAVAVSADRKGLVGGVDGKLFLIDLTDKAKPKPMTAHREAVLCAAFSPNGRLAATGGGGVLQLGALQPGRENAVCLWEVAGPTLRWRADAHARPVVSVAFSPDGHLLASGGADGEVRVWAVVDGKPVATLTGHTGRVLALAFTPDGKSLWSGAADRTLRQWQLP